MQLILISNRLGTAKSLVLSRRHLGIGAAGVALFVMCAATALTLFGLRQAAGSGTAQNLLLWSSAGTHRSLAALAGTRLDFMARQIGHMEAETTVLGLEAEGVAASAGLEVFEFGDVTAQGAGSAAPAALAGRPHAAEVEHALDQLAMQIRTDRDYFDVLRTRVLNDSARKQLLPTMLPVPDAEIGSGFGVRADPFSGAPAMHEGLDFVADVGTPIMAAGGGIVVFAGFHREFGNLVEIDHGNGILTRYGHCSRLDVKAGAVVRRGQVIAAVGESGRATGPHLHFEIRRNGVAQNPVKFLQADLKHLPHIARFAGRSQG